MRSFWDTPAPAQTDSEVLAMLQERFAALRIVGSWYRFEESLIEVLTARSDAWSSKAEVKAAGPGIGMAIIANPHQVSPFRTRVMAGGMKQSWDYILWMTRVFDQALKSLPPAECTSSLTKLWEIQGEDHS